MVDANDQFQPASAAAVGVELSRIIWVRCGGNAEHALGAADLVVHAGGSGTLVLEYAKRGLESWIGFRFPFGNVCGAH
ncbi:MAG: hypothetical protein ACR2IV_05155 [Bryobacteraceae bacterium]